MSEYVLSHSLAVIKMKNYTSSFRAHLCRLRMELGLNILPGSEDQIGNRPEKSRPDLKLIFLPYWVLL